MYENAYIPRRIALLQKWVERSTFDSHGTIHVDVVGILEAWSPRGQGPRWESVRTVRAPRHQPEA